MATIKRDDLLKAGVKHLKEFGYPKCTVDNIITDRVYGQFFESMLESTKDELTGVPSAVKVIDTVIAEIHAANK